MKLLEINIPQYNISQEPDADTIGKIVDDEIKKEFPRKSIVARGIASSEHRNKTQDDLISIISSTGSDRYDPNHVGDRYENIEDKHIDLFGVLVNTTSNNEIFRIIVWGFYHSAKAIHGYPVRIDIVIIYDADKLEQIPHQYKGRNDIKDDGFSFKDQKHRADAILGIVKIR